MRLRKAREADVPELLALINGYAARNLLLPRTPASLRSCIEDFTLAVAGKQILGCAALSALGPGLGEVRSLAVREDQTGRGVGREIVERLLREAAERRLDEVLALTRRVSFFAALGFVVTRRERFLDKLAADCAACPFNLNCDETAMVRLAQGGAAPRPPETPLALAEVNSARALPVAYGLGRASRPLEPPLASKSTETEGALRR